MTYNLGRYTESIRNEWDSLKQHDVLFLLSIQAHDGTSDKYKDETPFREHFGLKYVRGCEVSDIIGDDGDYLFIFIFIFSPFITIVNF